MQCIFGINTESNGSQHPGTLEPETTPIPLENCVWRRVEPSPIVFIVYAFVVPVLAIFGLCANFINAIVFMRPKMTPSAFTYFAALSWMDCASCLLITLTALSRSVCYASTFWITFDFQWQTPLFGITTGAANWILGAVSCDRLVYLWNGLPKAHGPPRFCRRKVARRVIVVIILLSILVNSPYFFVFVVNADGTFQTTKFYYSEYYKIHNWFTFILLTLIPAIFLFIGNSAIIIAFRRFTKQSKMFQRHNSNSKQTKTTQKRYKHQMKLTITVLIVITLYMIGELPAHMTSRKSALNLLFGGDVSKVNFELMEKLEVICISLNALQLSLNIIVYALINPAFMTEFFVCLRGTSDVCFKLFCLTALSNCCYSCCCKRSIAAPVTAPIPENPVPPPIERRQSNNSCHSKKSSSSDSSSSSNNWDTEPPGSDKIAAPTHRHRFNSKMYAESGIWSIELKWNRACSIGEFAFDNLAAELTETRNDAIQMLKTEPHLKRHSIAT